MGGLPWPIHGQLEQTPIACCDVFSGCLEALSKRHGMPLQHDAHNIRHQHHCFIDNTRSMLVVSQTARRLQLWKVIL